MKSKINQALLNRANPGHCSKLLFLFCVVLLNVAVKAQTAPPPDEFINFGQHTSPDLHSTPFVGVTLRQDQDDNPQQVRVDAFRSQVTQTDMHTVMVTTPQGKKVPIVTFGENTQTRLAIYHRNASGVVSIEEIDVDPVSITFEYISDGSNTDLTIDYTTATGPGTYTVTGVTMPPNVFYMGNIMAGDVEVWNP